MDVLEGKRARTRHHLEEIADAFRAVYPRIFAEQLEMARDVKYGLLNEGGFSNEGHFRISFSLHPTVHAFILHRLGHDFFKDPENCEMLRLTWAELAVPGKENKRPWHGIGTGTMREKNERRTQTNPD